MILRQCLFCTRHTPRPSQLCNKILYKTNEYRYCSENNNFGWLWFQFFKKRGTKGCVPIIVVSYCLALYVWKFTPESWKWGFNELLNLRSRRSNVGSILAMEQLTSYLPLWACWGGGGHGRLLIHGLWCTGVIAIQSRCMSIFSAQIQTRFQCVLNSARVAPCSWPFL